MMLTPVSGIRTRARISLTGLAMAIALVGCGGQYADVGVVKGPEDSSAPGDDAGAGRGRQAAPAKPVRPSRSRPAPPQNTRGEDRR